MPSTIELIPPTAAEREALKHFKTRYGKGWKSALLHKWKADTCHLEPHGDTLKRLGDELGPTWLKTFTL